MANAYKCDVCGKFHTREYVLDFTVLHYHRGLYEDKYDLCPDCQKELETWLNQGKEKSNGKV